MINKVISVSPGNIKMGAIPSISLPPIKTCAPGAPCGKDGTCYALKLCRLRPTVRDAYERNLAIWQEDPLAFETQATAAAITQRFFRWHVSGDIIGMDYLKMIVRIARNLPDTRFLMFTKRYDLVNDFAHCEDIPSNLHVIFSAWPGMDMQNPHDFPVAHVIFKGDDPDQFERICGGNCSDCACRGTGCWSLKRGESISFYEH